MIKSNDYLHDMLVDVFVQFYMRIALFTWFVVGNVPQLMPIENLDLTLKNG